MIFYFIFLNLNTFLLGKQKERNIRIYHQLVLVAIKLFCLFDTIISLGMQYDKVAYKVDQNII